MHSMLTFFALALAALGTCSRPSINPDRKVTRDFPGWSAFPAPTPSQTGTGVKYLDVDLVPSRPRPQAQARPQRAPPHRFGTRVRAAPQAVMAPPPRITQKCNIFVESESEYYGYLAPTFNDFGEYGVVQPIQNGSLEVSITYQPDSPSKVEFLATNGPVGAFPYLGGITGFSSASNNLGLDSSNYAYLGGTTQTPPRSPPVTADNSFSTITGIAKTHESAIWGFDPESMAITVQWINTDRSAPATRVVYAHDHHQALLITGDIDEFQYAFDVSYPEVILKCVPPAFSTRR